MKTVALYLFFYMVAQTTFAQNSTDYRDVFCGNYFGKKIYRHLDTRKNQIVYDTTTVIISVSKNNADSVFNINIGEGIINLKYINGKLYTAGKVRFSGNLTSTDIYLTHVPSPGPVSIIYYGTK